MSVTGCQSTPNAADGEGAKTASADQKASEPPTNAPVGEGKKPAVEPPSEATPAEPATAGPKSKAPADPARDALIAKITAASKAKDFDALRDLMQDEFYSLGPAEEDDDTSKESAIRRLRKHPAELAKLTALLSGPCGESDGEWMCPEPVSEFGEYGDAQRVSLTKTNDGWVWNLFIFDPETPISTGTHDYKAARKQIARGRKLSAKKELPQAVAAFERALELNPDSATAACEAGYAELRQGNLDRAQRFLELGLQLPLTAKKEAACRFNLGLVEEKRGETERALREYKRSLTLRDSKAVHARIARLSPSGRCLPKERPLDLTKVACGLPDDYWTCGIDESGHAIETFEFVDEYSDPDPLAPGVRLRAAAAMFNLDTRQRSDLVLEDGGKFFLLAELGWNISTDIDSKVETVRYAHRDLVPGGSTEVVVTVEITEDQSMSEANWYECEDLHGSDSSAEFDACIEKAESAGPTKITRYLGCGEIDGRWVCGESEVEPKTQEHFTAIFECR